MAFEDQSLGAFIEAKVATTSILQEQGLKSRVVSFEEALVMQAASHLLLTRPEFYGRQVSQMVQVHEGAIYPTLQRFEQGYGIVTSRIETPEELADLHRRSRRLYTPTEFGQQIFNLYQHK